MVDGARRVLLLTFHVEVFNLACAGCYARILTQQAKIEKQKRKELLTPQRRQEQAGSHRFLRPHVALRLIVFSIRVNGCQCSQLLTSILPEKVGKSRRYQLSNPYLDSTQRNRPARLSCSHWQVSDPASQIHVPRFEPLWTEHGFALGLPAPDIASKERPWGES